jgi:hypothetical protein
VIDTEKLFSNESAAALAKVNINYIAVRNQQAVADMNAERKQQSANVETDRVANTKDWWGSKILRGADWFGGTARTLLADSKTGRQTVQGRIAGTVIELGHISLSSKVNDGCPRILFTWEKLGSQINHGSVPPSCLSQ